ncbi:hypothetical protein TruAng_008947 [Truncatella angustata]|nr:hypothetical protein TruAng_008947 [Truncatella angustata]
MFMPMPISYTRPIIKTGPDNRTSTERGDGANNETAGGEDKQVTGKQVSTGRRRAFSGRSKKLLVRSGSGSESRSSSRQRTGKRKIQKRTQSSNGDGDSGSEAASRAIGRRSNDLGVPKPSSTSNNSTSASGGGGGSSSTTSPSREEHGRLLDLNLNLNSNLNPDPNPVAPPIPIITRKAPFNTTTTTADSPVSAASPSTVVSPIGADISHKPLPQIPSVRPTRESASVILSAASTNAARRIIPRTGRGTESLFASASASASAPTPTYTSTSASSASASASAIATAALRPRASSSSQSQHAANGSLSALNAFKNHPPIPPSPSYTGAGPGAGLGAGLGAGAGVSILPLRGYPQQGERPSHKQRQAQRRTSTTQHAAMVPAPSQSSSSTKSSSTSAAFRRTGSLSSTSISGVASSHRTGVMTSDHLPPSSHEGSSHISVGNISNTSGLLKTKISVGPKPLIICNGRTYIHDDQLPYPLPVDLAELHRQSLRTLLLFQLFGGPIISTAFAAKPPQRILEVGCGSGFWSMMCHRYFAQHGHHGISFTGIDIVPLCGTGPDPNSKPDKEMNWRFIQHDMRRAPWPFPDGEFDLVMVKDMACAAPGQFSQVFMDEYLRILRPGGVLEIWETDMSMRMLRPHVPATPATPVAAAPSVAKDSESESEEEDDATRLGVYVVSANTPLSAPLNQFLVEYNGWLSKALDAQYLSAVPCTMMGPMLLQEDGLIEVRSKRLAVPLSEIRWEREGVGGVVTKDGKSYIESMKGKGKAHDTKAGKGGKTLTAAQAAIRRTALETSVGLVQALEPMLREVSGKSQDEWDGWTGKMMNDLLRDGGTSWGECLEIGAWSARRKK